MWGVIGISASRSVTRKRADNSRLQYHEMLRLKKSHLRVTGQDEAGIQD
jgi:hypothetical protein